MAIFLLKIILAICFAWWGRKEIPAFALRINRQIYMEYHSLVDMNENYDFFQKKSCLQPKEMHFSYLFFLLFPSILILYDDVIIGGILILLCFLACLDIAYYLTDIRVVALIFLLSLSQGEINTLYVLIGLFIIIQIISYVILKKEGVGMGDYLLFLALAPLFQIEQMLYLILIASLLGIIYYLFYWGITKQKLAKLPFIPFITASTFIVFVDKI
ncbi:prepilin peptidase [uncultured Actinobacillus sp.]|uniref:prepilin peptidase n=1 Tax=uncultured Actinobacillus sp. TaxID=417616 RepID=UPI0025F9D35E|nr:prepilin peptidase [uncultured Actinobacillus sp.]